MSAAKEDLVGTTFKVTALDMEVIQSIMADVSYGNMSIPLTEYQFMLHQHESWKEIKSCREREECCAKLIRMGMVEADGEEA
jgi:hypothetical protein